MNYEFQRLGLSQNLENEQKSLIEGSKLEDTDHHKHSKSFHCKSFTPCCFLYVLCFSISCLIFAPYSSGLPSNVAVYAVVIDAGSTGSRVLALSFEKSAIDGSLKLQNDLFVQNKPGLSRFAENPEEGAKKIQELLEEAKKFVPKDAWNKTPIALRATAGLRLLPKDKAQNLLNQVEKVIKNSPFLSDENAVSIMDGKDEGLYSWLTVNFLLDRLKDNASKSVATLDLGGGSVQITFIPSQTKRIAEKRPCHLHKVSIMNKTFDMYSYSYLGLGLMAARRKVLLKENSENATSLSSSCVNPNISNAQWYFSGTSFNVSGSGNQDVKSNAEKCYQIVKSIVEEENVDKPTEVLDQKIVLISYFFDRAAEAGLIDRIKGGTIRLKDLQAAANRSCHNTNVDQPFMCLDLTIISSLLQHGLDFTPETPVTLLDTIDGHEISWALGAAYKLLEDKSSN